MIYVLLQCTEIVWPLLLVMLQVADTTLLQFAYLPGHLETSHVKIDTPDKSLLQLSPHGSAALLHLPPCTVYGMSLALLCVPRGLKRSAHAEGLGRPKTTVGMAAGLLLMMLRVHKPETSLQHCIYCPAMTEAAGQRPFKSTSRANRLSL